MRGPSRGSLHARPKPRQPPLVVPRHKRAQRVVIEITAVSGTSYIL